MAPTHLVRGTVPPDSPLRSLAGRAITAPACGLREVADRIIEMRALRMDPAVMPAPRPVPWTGMAVTITGGIIIAVVGAIEAILDGRTTHAGVYAAAMLLLGASLFPVLTHLEMDQEIECEQEPGR